MSTSRWGSAAIAALVLAAGLGGATLLFAQPSTEDRRRAVADWLVEDVAEEDGTRIVRMTRELDGSRLEYSLAFPRGAAGPVRGISAEHLGCGSGGGIGIASVADEAPAPSVRSELGRYLASCEVQAAAVEAALGGFDPAFALTLTWAGEVATTTAQSEAAESYNEAYALQNATACEPSRMNAMGYCQ